MISDFIIAAACRRNGGKCMKIDINTLPSIDQLAGQYLAGKNEAPRPAEKTPDFSEILASKQERAEKAAARMDGMPLERSKPQGLPGSEIGGSRVAPRFSKHAMGRLNDRRITLTEEQLGRLTEGTGRAEAKGINESLVMVDDLAFIVNIRNNTVVTAMDSTLSDESVYTNIDGAVIA